MFYIPAEISIVKVLCCIPTMMVENSEMREFQEFRENYSGISSSSESFLTFSFKFFTPEL